MDVVCCVTEFDEAVCTEEYECDVSAHVEHAYEDSTVEVLTEVATFLVDIFIEDVIKLVVLRGHARLVSADFSVCCNRFMHTG